MANKKIQNRSKYVKREFERKREQGIPVSKAVKQISRRLFLSEQTIYRDLSGHRY